jgi:flagellar biosynthesis anti-sigma factor FlgM
MKVDLHSVAAAQPAVDRSAKPVTNASVAASQAATTDRTTLHSDQAVQSLAAKALQQPEIRQPAVEALRQSVSNGSYQADASRTAAAIISHES